MSVVITLCVITDNCNCVSALEETFILHTRSCKNGFDLNIRKLKMWGFFFFCLPASRYPPEHSLEGSQTLPVCPDESSSCKMSVDTLWSDTDGEIRSARSARRKPRPKASLSTTDLAGIGLGSNPGLRGDGRLLPSEDSTLWRLSLSGTPQRCARFGFPQ